MENFRTVNNRKPVVVGIGELLWDMLPAGRRAGGAPVNLVYHAIQAGAEGYAVSAVGRDADGDEILHQLQLNGIGHCIARADRPTGTVPVTLSADGIPTYTIVEDVAWDHIPLTDEALAVVRRADALCFGTLAHRAPASRATLMALADAAPADALRFFDINLRQHYYSKELIETLLERAGMLKINDEELDIVRPLFALPDDTDEACRALLQRYRLHALVLTAGARFSAVYTETETSVIDTPKVHVADTVGAGDAFSGAFVHAILTGRTLREAHRAAVDTAAFVCTRAGAWPVYDEHQP